jgi:hypothetical protein
LTSRAHNPEVVGSNPTPATNFIDSQGLGWVAPPSPFSFGKDLGKKSVFPHPVLASRSRTAPQVFPPPRARPA